MYLTFNPDETALHLEGQDDFMFEEMESLGMRNIESTTVFIDQVMFTVYHEGNQDVSIERVGFQPSHKQFFRGPVVMHTKEKASAVLSKLIYFKDVVDTELDENYETLVGADMIEYEVV